jgi:hypothetical protein
VGAIGIPSTQLILVIWERTQYLESFAFVKNYSKPCNVTSIMTLISRDNSLSKLPMWAVCERREVRSEEFITPASLRPPFKITSQACKNINFFASNTP